MNYNVEKIFGIFIIAVLIMGTIIIFSTQQVVNKYQFTRDLKQVDKNQMFDLLADVENYPKIFPKYIKSVKILNHTNDVIITEETISYEGITRIVEVKHEIKPYEYHKVTALSGEFKNSSFMFNFTQKHPNTFELDAEIYFPAYLGFFINNSPTGINNFAKNMNTIYREIPMEFKK